MDVAIRFIPVMLLTLGLGIISFAVKKAKRLPWLIIAFIIWLFTFFYAIGIIGNN